jgi:hypothetical protein
VEAASNSDDHSEDEYEQNFKDDCADHHFGLSCNADEPYASRGRSEALWKISIAYGSCRSMSKGEDSFDGPVPGPCFEMVAWLNCTKGEVGPSVLEWGEIGYCTIADEIG